jgi:hypothetical protein
MPQEFKRRRGYDLTPFLAAFAQRTVGSEAETARFRADFQRTIQDLYIAAAERRTSISLPTSPSHPGRPGASLA